MASCQVVCWRRAVFPLDEFGKLWSPLKLNERKYRTFVVAAERGGSVEEKNSLSFHLAEYPECLEWERRSLWWCVWFMTSKEKKALYDFKRQEIISSTQPRLTKGRNKLSSREKEAFQKWAFHLGPWRMAGFEMLFSRASEPKTRKRETVKVILVLSSTFRHFWWSLFF